MTKTAAPQHDINSPESLAGRRHGQAVLSHIDGHQGEAVIDSLADINPAVGHHVAALTSVTSTTAPVSTRGGGSSSPSAS